MMTREQRAKQFQPFDAMKGLQEALRDREERHSRTEKHDISEEAHLHNMNTILRLRKHMRVHVEYYCAFHDVERSGTVTELDTTFGFVRLGEEKIFFEDIYDIRILDASV